MLVSMHNPGPDGSTIELANEATLGLAELLFTELDNSGFTEIFVKLAPLALALNTRARAQLFAIEQEMLSPLAIPAEAWSLVWQDFDTKATLLENALTRKRATFRFSDSLADLERRARDPGDKVDDLKVKGGYRVIGTGLTTFPEPDAPFTGTPLIFHYSPFSWRKFFVVAASTIIGAVNTTAVVVTAGVSVASVGTAAAVGGWWAGSGDL
jgi:hypothetical protein